MRMAASSPVWFTRNAEERNSRCSDVSGRIGLPSFVVCGEDGVDAVLENRSVSRGAQVAVLGARKSRTGYCRLRQMLRDNVRDE